MYDTEARWMLNKKEKDEVSYNLQSAADYTSKLILAIHVSDKASDHYQFPQRLIRPYKIVQYYLTKLMQIQDITIK